MPEKVKKHTHVTARVYLRRFAADGLLVAERTGCEPEPIGVPEVAVRKRFYTLKRSDGTSSNEVENSLGILENKVTTAFTAQLLVDNHRPLDQLEISLRNLE